VLLLVGSCWADQQQLPESSDPVDASFINDLAKKPVKLDPKLRKALLKVLTRLEEEDKLLTDARPSGIESQPAQQQQQQQQLLLQDKLQLQRQEQQQQLQFQRQEQQQLQFLKQEQQQQQQKQQEEFRERIKERKQELQQEQIKQQQAQHQNFGPTLSTALPTPEATAFSTAANSVLPTISALLPTPGSAEPAAKSPGTAVNDTTASRASPPTETGTVVDFFEAPLLTAFTVQQDSAGVARRVIPIYTEPGQLERQKIQALETKVESESGDRNTVEPDKRELEFLKNVELAQFGSQPTAPDGSQPNSFALREQQRFQQQQQQQQQSQQRFHEQQIQPQHLELQPLQNQLRPFQQQLQVLDQVRPVQVQQRQIQQLQPIQPLQPFRAQQFVFGPFLQPEQQFAPQQLRVLRQPQQQTFGYGLPKLPGDLDVVYKVLALNHEGRHARLQVPRPHHPGPF